MSLLVFLTLMSAQPGSAIAASDQETKAEIHQETDPLSPKIDEAFAFIRDGKPAQALPILDGVIASEEALHRDEKRVIYSARTLTEAMVYAGLAASQKKSAVVVDDTYAMGYFIKGFALIDLNRPDEAKPLFDRALALAPMNSQFLAERGEWFKTRKDWARAYEDFEAASAAAEFADESSKSSYRRRAWRGMAYARIEEGRIEEARELLQKCMKLEPDDEKCQHELDYIASLKKPAS